MLKSPKIGRNNTAFTTLSATPNTVVGIPIPGTFENATRPKSYTIYFTNAGAIVGGRFAVAPAGTVASFGLDTFDDDDIELGYTQDTAGKEFGIPGWAKQIFIASSTASAKAIITWYY